MRFFLNHLKLDGQVFPNKLILNAPMRRGEWNGDELPARLISIYTSCSVLRCTGKNKNWQDIFSLYMHEALPFVLPLFRKIFTSISTTRRSNIMSDLSITYLWLR